MSKLTLKQLPCTCCYEIIKGPKHFIISNHKYITPYNKADIIRTISTDHVLETNYKFYMYEKLSQNRRKFVKINNKILFLPKPEHFLLKIFQSYLSRPYNPVETL